MSDETQFPILLPWRREEAKKLEGFPKSVPWDFVAPFERQALSNHSQTLKRLAERGGLSWAELLAVTTKRAWYEVSKITDVEAAQEVTKAIESWRDRTTPEGA